MPDEEGGRAQCLGYSWREAFLGYFLVPLTSALGQARVGISAADAQGISPWGNSVLLLFLWRYFIAEPSQGGQPC